jgi:hypothetical protein
MKIRDMPTYLFFCVSRLVCTLISAFSPYRTRTHSGSTLLIEAGELGWREPAPGLLDIEQSACEYIGPDSVFRVEVPLGTRRYLRTVIDRIKTVQPTHFFYDTRTGSQGIVHGLVQSLLLAAYLSWKNIVPLTILTNFPTRKWRRQVSVITARKGIILILVDPRVGLGRIPHTRVLGPIFMPFSRERLENLRHRFSTARHRTGPPVLTFIGSVYEPRATTLRHVSKALETVAVDFRVVSRNVDEKKIEEHPYWSVLRSSDFIFTTSDHIVEPGADTDIPPHMVYRYTEALVAEGCLIAPIVSGPLVPNVHYVPYLSPEQLADELSTLLENPEKIENIRMAGSELIASRVEGNAWWTEIDHKLGADALKAKLIVE